MEPVLVDKSQEKTYIIFHEWECNI